MTLLRSIIPPINIPQKNLTFVVHRLLRHTLVRPPLRGRSEEQKLYSNTEKL